MRIVVDLDGTICTLRKPDEDYTMVRPMPGAIEALKRLRANGHQIIIQTARNMGTCEGNLGRVMHNVGKITFDWLAQHGVEYDEIYFGKPNGHLYIDDRAFRWTSWDEVSDETLAALAREQ